MSLTFRILGCGSSGGVPRLDGSWGECDPAHPKNHRTRCSLLVQQSSEAGQTSVLIDTSPDMRAQLIEAQTTWLDAILYSHDHADQTHGIDDVRAMVYARRQQIDVWMDQATADTLTSRFDYCFHQSEGSLYPAILKDNRITTPYEPIRIAGEGGGITATPFRQIHGSIDSLGFRIGDVAYSSDISDLPEESFADLEGLDCWIVDALRREPHPTHFHLDKTLELIETLKPKRAILTNLHIDLDYETLCKTLPKGVMPAYDGMVFSAKAIVD
ncbi:MAG: MBL fold metallo-hydrolase [Rhodobiaceae bacterium]|jgi:phosphoribosyl 1,2-cyclic phosphate phosphodiesterase|nr:MBL fold metallo-hydrolase [Rhodobiaceae bacterium]MBT7279350.1 MBL fold metallo-hydrolase [Rhodobiaceae bacterium]